LPSARYDEASDAQLASWVAKGDHDCFEAVMRRHNRALFRTARAILRDDAEAEDALQEAYLQAYRSIGSYRAQARLSTWLARIVANEALMRLRKHTRRSTILPLHAGASVEEIDEMAQSGIDKDPEHLLRRAEMRKLLEERIDALPGAYRVVFMLRAVEEYSVEETAAILGIGQATVRSRFFRARSLLREGLASEVDLACEDTFGFAAERCDRVVAAVMARLAEEKPPSPQR
ncbi:MAG TPA: RNA polymerase sigma factor, partial [Burkholderiaceae bacterium]|nr:RNA polymerase sigma factor [Burkholderiaceae bacterium]